MELKTVTIQNFKGIKDVTIDFKAGFNILIGDNGVGKTSLLEAISVGLGGFLAGIDGSSKKNISSDEVRINSKLTGDGSISMKQEYPVSIECSATFDENIFTWIRQKKTLQGRTTVEPRAFSKIGNEMLDDLEKVAPLINYQSAARMWAQKREKTNNVFKKTYTRSVGYIDCLAEESNTKMLINWCKRMEEISWQEDKKISEYESVKAAVVSFMSIMCESSVTGVRFDKRTEQLVYNINDENIPIHLLSSGYQSVIWMVMDIAYRMAVLNPNLRSDATRKTPGIVLIDELDLHLHPKWQWKIVEALKTTFPQVQFIATTHSPIIVASSKNEHLIMVSQDMNVEYGNSAYGQEVGDVLTYKQGSHDRVKPVADKFDEFYQAIDEERYDEAKRILNVLIEELGRDNESIVRAQTRLDFETAFLGE